MARQPDTSDAGRDDSDPDRRLLERCDRLTEKLRNPRDHFTQDGLDVLIADPTLSAELSALRHDVEKRTPRLQVLHDAVEELWKPRRLQDLFRMLFPQKQSGQRGTKIPSAWFELIEKRPPEERDALVRDLVEKNGALDHMVDPKARDKYLANRVRYVLQKAAERNRIL